MNAGENIQKLRVSRNISLRSLARQSDISPGHLSQIENGKVDPSLSMLTKISTALKVPLYSLLLGDRSVSHTLVKANERNKLIFAQDGLEAEIIHMDYSKRFDLSIISLHPSAASSDVPVLHDGDECIFVLAGRLRVEFSKQAIDLEKGDSLYFESATPHRLINIGSDLCKFIHSHSPPGFPGRRIAMPDRKKTGRTGSPSTGV